MLSGDAVSALTDSSDQDEDKGKDPKSSSALKTIFESLVKPPKEDLVVDVGEDGSLQPAPPSLEDRIRKLGNSAKSYFGGLATPFSGEKPKVATEGSITSGADNVSSAASGAGNGSSFDFKTPRTALLNHFDNAATDDKTPRRTNSSKQAKRSISSTKSKNSAESKNIKKVRQYHWNIMMYCAHSPSQG